ncbi:MAG: FprA family A-type flavoprotein [Clostridiales bacterium]|jgi:flavorubredoxin|nr:FprA family A-type flavoprotein [Clostridiales bacterium]
MFAPLQVKDDIFWTGALDYNIRVFDIIMRTGYGTTYNSFVVKGTNKTVLFEVAKEAFFDEFFERLTAVTDPAAIDYIVLDHTEPDHTSCLYKLLPHCPNATIVATSTALRFIAQILNQDFAKQAVKDGDVLDIGGKTLHFIPVPFLHWPDTMFTYIPECKTIFTCDAFGCHYCDAKVFNDQITGDFEEAYKYYFDSILGPFKAYTAQALKKIENLEIETICNGHGPVIRSNPQSYLDLYRQWSQPVKKDRASVVIAYVTAYGYTRKLAEAIAEGLRAVTPPDDRPLDIRLFDLAFCDKPQAIEAMENADGILLGSPTLVGDALPPVYDVLIHMNPIIHKGKIAGLFGSYGWSGEAVPNLEGRVKQLKWRMPIPSLKVQFRPSDEDLSKAVEFGRQFGEEIQKKR